ncbi:MAG TPA: glycosyltransferase [Candidatus Paceibacterota bacterium]|nr:glycosyltransferase [Candidatus Paceibacterota bacterium]
MEPSRRKKILFVITKANWGGAQRYVYDLATSLPKDAFEVQVAFGQSGRLAEELQAARITTHPIATLQRDLSLTAELRSFFELERLLRTEKPDIVHLNSSKAGGLGALAARCVGVPRIIFTAHGWPFSEQRNLAWRALAWFGSWATALLSHAVICVSKNDLHAGQRLPFCRAKMHLVYNGIEPSPLGDGTVIRNAFPSGARITGTIGELTKNKDQMSLVEQARRDQDLFVAIVGEGEERPRLEAKIKAYGLKERVKLFGFIPAHEVLRGFDTFALPSLKEGLPYVLLEARAAGLPILANRVGGVSEILDAEDMSEFSLERMVRKTTAIYTD